MNNKYIPADISYPVLIRRAYDWRRIVTYLSWYLSMRWRFHLAWAIAALLLSATDAPAATITVTNGNDSGPGSLRQAILNAPSGDTINFSPSVTVVNLTSSELVINKNLTITGPGAKLLTVKRSASAPAFRIFHITPSTVTVSISGLTISNGSVVWPFGGPVSLADGGGIRSAGVLTLADSIISANQSSSDSGVGGNGGGVLNEGGTMTITRCTISNNSAHYSVGSPEESGHNSGGGILNYSGGSLTITNSTISGNLCTFQGGIVGGAGGRRRC
jgi:hypothetical protein